MFCAISAARLPIEATQLKGNQLIFYLAQFFRASGVMALHVKTELVTVLVKTMYSGTRFHRPGLCLAELSAIGIIRLLCRMNEKRSVKKKKKKSCEMCSNNSKDGNLTKYISEDLRAGK